MTALVKICGMMRLEDAEAAAQAGADYIGFVFAESRRRVEPAFARVATERARAIRPAIRAVGLFVDAPRASILRVSDDSGIDLVQLHGMPDVETIDAIGLPSLIVVRDTPGHLQHDLIEYATAVSRSNLVELVMIDSYHPSRAGGTGTRANWELAADLARQAPLMLAGGLDPVNVAEAIDVVRPAAVDVSTGVERAGAKDPELIRRFVTNAKAAFHAAGYSTSSGTSSQDAP